MCMSCFQFYMYCVDILVMVQTGCCDSVALGYKELLSKLKRLGANLLNNSKQKCLSFYFQFTLMRFMVPRFSYALSFGLHKVSISAFVSKWFDGLLANSHPIHKVLTAIRFRLSHSLLDIIPIIKSSTSLLASILDLFPNSDWDLFATDCGKLYLLSISDLYFVPLQQHIGVEAGGIAAKWALQEVHTKDWPTCANLYHCDQWKANLRISNFCISQV